MCSSSIKHILLARLYTMEIRARLPKNKHVSSGAGAINYHFVYHPPHLNVKILSNGLKRNVEKNMKHGILVEEN